MALAGREDHDRALEEFDDLLMQHIGFAVSNAASTLLLGLTFGHLGSARAIAWPRATSAASTASRRPSPCSPTSA